MDLAKINTIAASSLTHNLREPNSRQITFSFQVTVNKATVCCVHLSAELSIVQTAIEIVIGGLHANV